MIDLEHIESDTPQDQQKYKGWFYLYPHKKFYRWDDFLEQCRIHDRQTKQLRKYPDGKMGIGSYDKLTNEEQAKALEYYKYKGYGPKNERWEPTSDSQQLSKNVWWGQGDDDNYGS